MNRTSRSSSEVRIAARSPGALDRGPGRVPDVDPELAGDDRGERGLAEARRAVEQDVVGGLSPALRRLQQHREVGLDLALADVFVERSRPQRPLDDAIRSSSRSAERMCEMSSAIAESLARASAFRTDVRHRARSTHHPTRDSGARMRAMRLSRRSEYGLRALIDLVRHERRRADRRWRRSPTATGSRSSSSSRSWPRSSTPASSARRSGRTAAMPSRRTRRASRWAGGPAPGRGAGAARLRSLRYYEPCSCPDEATARCATR